MTVIQTVQWEKRVTSHLSAWQSYKNQAVIAGAQGDELLADSYLSMAEEEWQHTNEPAPQIKEQ